ncbi:MAG: hypothetical protein M3Z11_11750, partial [Candidatus Dormibacteraeota bacterium]|nr:hypothetical protein [Candidatus Dormibacteraeota bacterium]
MPEISGKEVASMRVFSQPSVIVRLVIAVGLGLLAAACGTPAPGGSIGGMASADKQVLRISSTTEPNSLDPGQQTFDYEGVIGRQTFEAPLRPKPDLTDVQGAAASSYDISSDG